MKCYGLTIKISIPALKTLAHFMYGAQSDYPELPWVLEMPGMFDRPEAPEARVIVNPFQKPDITPEQRAYVKKLANEVQAKCSWLPR